MNVAPCSKYSEVLADWLVELGYTHCFMVAGGGCMHLIDGFRTRFIAPEGRCGQPPHPIFVGTPA